jgi:flagellar basal body-associated protein FliL
MVQKAKLDVLENLPDIEMMDLITPNEEHEEFSELPLPVYRGKWALNKLVLIAAPAVIVVLVITGVLWSYLTRTDNTVTKLQSVSPAVSPAAIIEKTPQGAGTTSAQAAIEPVKVNKAYFKDFIIDLKDKTGKCKILMCDVVFEVSEAGNIAELENREDIRNMIYQTATGKNAVVLRSIEERKKLKNELLQEANKMLGDGIIKNVYFTNYVIM